MHLDGKVAIVTGASRGIGRAISRGLAAHGARVVVASLCAYGGIAHPLQKGIDHGEEWFQSHGFGHAYH
jgi:NAD(P)-dependent dehydrogenase (short-subunit alcohol dehydrogenase family)